MTPEEFLNRLPERAREDGRRLIELMEGSREDADEVQKNWKNALQAADNRYHALRQAAVYAEATGADPEMIKEWKRTLWNSPESEWPDLTPEAERMKATLAQKR